MPAPFRIAFSIDTGLEGQVVFAGIYDVKQVGGADRLTRLQVHKIAVHAVGLQGLVLFDLRELIIDDRAIPIDQLYDVTRPEVEEESAGQEIMRQKAHIAGNDKRHDELGGFKVVGGDPGRT